MKKNTKIFLAAGAVIVLGVGLFFGRNIIRDLTAEKIEQDESIKNEDSISRIIDEGELVEQGTFVDIDSVHKGSGQASIYEIDGEPKLVFEDNFVTTNGPDLVVYLANDPVASTQDLGDFVSLGDLDSDSGLQVYDIPTDYAEFNSVVIWCRAFGVLFTAADLEEV